MKSELVLKIAIYRDKLLEQLGGKKNKKKPAHGRKFKEDDDDYMNQYPSSNLVADENEDSNHIVYNQNARIRNSNLNVIEEDHESSDHESID